MAATTWFSPGPEIIWTLTGALPRFGPSTAADQALPSQVRERRRFSPLRCQATTASPSGVKAAAMRGSSGFSTDWSSVVTRLHRDPSKVADSARFEAVVHAAIALLLPSLRSGATQTQATAPEPPEMREELPHEAPFHVCCCRYEPWPKTTAALPASP